MNKKKKEKKIWMKKKPAKVENDSKKKRIKAEGRKICKMSQK